jgi:GTPase SAR1 family protein
MPSTIRATVKYEGILSKLNELFEKYQLPNQQLLTTIDKVNTYKVVTPLVGGFSSGKSSLINTILNNKILAVEIDPATALPTEITYHSMEQFTVFGASDSKRLTKSEFQQLSIEASKMERVRVELNHPFLQEIEHVMIVDMPGLDSGIDAHNRAIDDYLTNSLAYIITVDAELGTIRESTLLFLQELKLYEQKPVLIAITKCDSKTDDEIAQIERDVRDKVQHILKISDAKVVLVSSVDGKTEQVKEFLQFIQQQAEEIFVRHYQPRVAQELQQMQKYLQTRIDRQDSNEDELAEEEHTQNEKFAKAEEKFRQEKERFHSQVGRCQDAILNRVRSKLHNAAESLARDLIKQRDVRSQVNQIVRQAIHEGVRSDFEPELQKYFQRINDLVEMDHTPEQVFQIDQNAEQMNIMLKDLALRSIPLIMAAIGGVLAGPIGAVVGGVLTFIVERLCAHQMEEEKKRNALEKVHNELIPQIISQSSGSIQDAINRTVNEVNEKVEANMERQRETHAKTIEALREQRQMQQAQLAKVLDSLAHDINLVQELSTQL